MTIYLFFPVVTRQYAMNLWKDEAIKDQAQKWKQIYQGHQSRSQDLQQILCQKCCAFSVKWIAGKLSSQLELWKTFRQAIKISKDLVLMTSLSSAISPNDAHAIDLKYHKLCWTPHVFHVPRDHASDNAKSTTADLPMQMSCLIKLINLVKLQTQNKAYIPMHQIEATLYISMLGVARHRNTTQHWQDNGWRKFKNYQVWSPWGRRIGGSHHSLLLWS